MLINREGQIAGKYRKVHPAALLSLEKNYFRGGSSFPVFQLGELTVGISTCYDNLFPESRRRLALRGAELIVAPCATPIEDPWENFLSTRALENGVYFAESSRSGGRVADVGQGNFPLFRDRRPDVYSDIAAKPEDLLN